MDVPPFVPQTALKPPKRDPLVVLTTRIAPSVREELHRFWRLSDPRRYNSVSHVVQCAIDEFLRRHK